MNPYANLMNDALTKKFLDSDKPEVKVEEVHMSAISAQEAFRELMCDGKLNGDAKLYNDISKEGL